VAGQAAEAARTMNSELSDELTRTVRIATHPLVVTELEERYYRFQDLAEAQGQSQA
jgi:hypothetical protein